MSSTVIQTTIYPERIIFHRDDWGIASCSLVEDEDVGIKVDYRGRFVIKGKMPPLQIGQEYDVKLKPIEDAQYGLQYEVMYITIPLRSMNDEDKEVFLRRIFTEQQVANMYAALEDPFDALKEQDTIQLVQVRGCGIKTAVNWIERFNQHYYLSRLYVELNEYNLTNVMIRKIIDEYKSPELLIDKIKNNPYVLTEISGIGWKTVDKIAMEANFDEYSELRIGGFILYTLDRHAMEGNSYIATDVLMDEIVMTIGEEVPDLAIATAIHNLKDVLWWDENKEFIGLKRYYVLEERIASEMERLNSAKSIVSKISDSLINKIIIQKQKEQGWDFTDQQLEAIYSIIENNITIIHGLAGTGKSTIIEVALEILQDYSSAVCALSGKASARLSEMANIQGYTIHRLLQYTGGKTPGFLHNKENPLDYDIIVVDEISMIDATLFYDLIQAIPDGAKLILLGDIGQLENIGVGKIAVDLINSTAFPTIYLDVIHRQAQKSAIITESIKIRKGHPLLERNEVVSETRGELQDLKIETYSDKSNTYYKALQYFSTFIEEGHDIMDVQLLCPIKSKGMACTDSFNSAIQELYNPLTKDKNEIYVESGGRSWVLREGDKIINVRNNYRAQTIEQQTIGVFNGNVGVIKSIDLENQVMIVDFKTLGEIIIPQKNYSDIELGYAVSVHKYQGSQSKIVIFAFDYSAFKLLSRQLLYTGITRAEALCVVVAQNTALYYATLQETVSKSNTHLYRILTKSKSGKLIF